MSVDTCGNPAVCGIITGLGLTGQKNKRAVKEENWQRQITKQVNRQINWQSGRLEHSNKHEYLYCMDNDMVLEMKAETMQIALTLCSYHDDQPPEVGGKSQERSAGGRGGTRELCVLVLQCSMYPLTARRSSRCCAIMVPMEGFL